MEVQRNETCAICDRILNSDVVVTVKERGLSKFVESSLKRNDGKEECFKNRVEIQLHKTCRNSYNNPKCIEAVLLRIDQVNILEKKARYHYKCYSKFCHSYRAAGLKRGRQQSLDSVSGMDQVYQFIEGDQNDCQYSLPDIREALKNVTLPSDAMIKYHLKQRYGDKFIKAERTGDWFLHLDTIKRMLPYFHAADHYNYSKSANLYVQEMTCIEEKMSPDYYEKFVKEGLFTIRRTKKHCSGTWTDMTIEQSLMRSMKTSGGFTRGRGYSEDVLGKWVLGLPIFHCITETIENFCDFGTNESSSHKDGTKSRIERDAKDIILFTDWFREHNPFPDTEDIMSISTGIVSNSDVNPHKARCVGEAMMIVPDGTTYGQMKYSRKQKVKSLATASSAVNVQDVIVPIEPDLIFKRISFVKKTQDELKEFLKYELSPYPMSLFDKNGMRKSAKSVLYDMFKPVPEETICGGTQGERKKIASSKSTGSASGDVHKSNWFAYDSLLFLVKGATSSGSMDSMNAQTSESTVAHEQIPAASQVLTQPPEAPTSPPPLPTQPMPLTNTQNKRKKDDLSEVYEIMKSAKARMDQQKDEYQIYADYIASELRNIKNEHAVLQTKYFINNILLEARMGKYNYTENAMGSNSSDTQSYQSYGYRSASQQSSYSTNSVNNNIVTANASHVNNDNGASAEPTHIEFRQFENIQELVSHFESETQNKE
ncbi:hypothetical protein HF086_000408 [Spodoptera exigua]|uniref:Uncharacterized protein n=1 Tax=Spodoptera exigua TaxID=7107 RepID=A0A922SDL9_SPOEX|nr:hypothetical protein HF086_000408 [Spodoptera exigua]